MKETTTKMVTKGLKIIALVFVAIIIGYSIGLLLASIISVTTTIDSFDPAFISMFTIFFFAMVFGGIVSYLEEGTIYHFLEGIDEQDR